VLRTTNVTERVRRLEFSAPCGFPRGAAREPLILLAVLLAALTVSGIAPKDRWTWVLEEAPVFLGVPVLIATFQRFRLTPLSYRLIFLHAVLLIVGGHYTYSAVPAGLWLRDALGFARNHFDRIVHFVGGGIAPAILAREVLLRRTRLRPGGWLFSVVAFCCLGGGALYEILEWWAAKLGGFEASAFLAAQGDVWDAQWDMFLGLLGAVVGQLWLARRQDRELVELFEVTAIPGQASSDIAAPEAR
jgi:putative membrane protein